MTLDDVAEGMLINFVHDNKLGGVMNILENWLVVTQQPGEHWLCPFEGDRVMWYEPKIVPWEGTKGFLLYSPLPAPSSAEFEEPNDVLCRAPHTSEFLKIVIVINCQVATAKLEMSHNHYVIFRHFDPTPEAGNWWRWVFKSPFVPSGSIATILLLHSHLDGYTCLSNSTWVKEFDILGDNKLDVIR